MKIAVVRGKFLNAYEMQFFAPLGRQFDLTAFGSLTCYHDKIGFPVLKLLSPMDLPEFPHKLPILNRLFTDAHYLFGLENRLTGFDLVHTAETYFHFTQQCLNAKRQGRVKKVIATVLENIPFNNEGIWGRKDYKARARRELDHIIALTEKTKSALIAEGADPNKITVIGHFIDTNRFQVKIKHQILKAKSRNINILYCGRLERYKGVYEILEAASILVQDKQLADYKLHFTFVGDGNERESMQRIENKLRLDSLVTHKNASYAQMPSVYQTADIYVAPSKSTPTWSEQYNTTLLEAQASGLPIVTTNSGAIGENVGDAAIKISEERADELAAAIKKFVLNPRLRQEYAGRARRRAETVHDAQIGARKLAALYRRVIDEP